MNVATDLEVIQFEVFIDGGLKTESELNTVAFREGLSTWIHQEPTDLLEAVTIAGAIIY